MVRSADDCIIPGTSTERLEGEGKPGVEQCRKERGLALSQAQTVVTCVANGFEYLGPHGRQSHGTYLAKPSRKHGPACLETVRSIVKANKQAKVDTLSGLRQPGLRGWAT
jgi:RNA-directed DNA polymerase